MKFSLRATRKEMPAVIISSIAMSLAILSFFGITDKIFPKDQIPSAILALISGITIVEILERWDLQETSEHEKSGFNDELKRISTTLIQAESELKSISNIAQLIEEIEGNNFFINEGFSGEWFSFYEGHVDPNNPELIFDWCSEIIEIVELGRLLYIETKVNKKQERIKALGKLIEKRTLMGHWITCIPGACKQGEFLLKQDGYGDMLYGTYSAPHDNWHHPFYNWILIKKIDPRTGQQKSPEAIFEQIQAAWSKLKPLKAQPDISEVKIDDFITLFTALEKVPRN